MAKIETGRFVWFELMTNEPRKAQGFLAEVFHWKTQDMPIPGGGTYTMITLDGTPIGGYRPTAAGAPTHAHWISNLQVADAIAVVEQIKSLGGKVRKPPEKMGDMGTSAIVADPFDATFALWQPAKPEGTGDYLGKENAWCWNELTTPEPEKSVAFYSKIGGFTETKMQSGPMTYHVLNSGGKTRAGITKPMMEGVPTMWTPYVNVGKADAIVDKVKKLGATVHAGPMDIPNVGRFAVFTEPNAGTLGILQPVPGSG
jgi:predicted enzyme related to lactoylglutathione lyase